MIKKVQLAGPSGIGKTTIATSGIYPFVSASVSDLLPKTKDTKHSDMLSRDSKELLMEDYQVLNLRNKLFNSLGNVDYISDRSFLDLAAYFYLKQSGKIPACELETFLTLCKNSLCETCTHLVLFDFLPEQLREWVIEDNNKRITSNYFQLEIAEIMKLILKLWGYEYKDYIYKLGIGNNLKYGAKEGIISSIHGEVRVLILRELNLDNRLKIINKFLNNEKTNRFSIF